jgi:hypothetical protein
MTEPISVQGSVNPSPINKAPEQQPKKDKSIALYTDGHGNQVKLSYEICKSYLHLENASDQELGFFMAMAQAARLNPFLHEIYAVKIKDQAMYTVVAYQEFIKQAAKSGHYKGYKITDMKYDEGTKLPIQGTIVVARDDRDPAFYTSTTVLFSECAKTFRYADKDHKAGDLMALWANSPRQMFEKVLIKRGHMLAFPENDVLQQLASTEASTDVEMQMPLDAVEGAGRVVTTESGETVVAATGEVLEPDDIPATDNEKVNVAAICAYMKWTEEALSGELQRAKVGVTTLDQLTHGCYLTFMKDWRNWAGIWGFELTAEGMPVQAAPVAEPKATPKK